MPDEWLLALNDEHIKLAVINEQFWCILTHFLDNSTPPTYSFIHSVITKCAEKVVWCVT